MYSSLKKAMDNSKPLKIAFFVGIFPILSETFVIRQVAGMVKMGHEVTVIAGKLGDTSVTHELYRSYQLDKLTKEVRPNLNRGIEKFRSIFKFFISSLLNKNKFKRMVIAINAAKSGSTAALLDIASISIKPTLTQHLGEYDVIVAHFGPAGVRAMYLIEAGLLRGNLATVFHGSDMSEFTTIERHRKNYQKLFSKSQHLLPISNLWNKRLIEWGAPENKITVIRMGVDLDRLGEFKGDRPIRTPIKVLSVARFTEKKGLQYAIEGVRLAKNPIHFDIIGSGPLESNLRDLSFNGSHENNIVFHGRKSQEDVFLALERADVFLLPSVTALSGDMEGVPVALMEAMAKGIIVIATDHSGIPELIKNLWSGFLVPERCATSIAAVLDQISLGMIDPIFIRNNARLAVEASFDNEKLDIELDRICRRLVISNLH